jgi:hypothetical protein
MALADAAEKAKLPRLFLVHNEGTQNQIAAVKRVAISVANDNNPKSCHSDQLSRHGDALRGLIWGTQLHLAAQSASPAVGLKKRAMTKSVSKFKVSKLQLVYPAISN